MVGRAGHLWSRAHNAMSDADFLLPMTRDDQFAYPLVPMPYSQALHWLRYFCTLPWKNSAVPDSANPGDYTLHSLKTTTLSWSNNLPNRGWLQKSNAICKDTTVRVA